MTDNGTYSGGRTIVLGVSMKLYLDVLDSSQWATDVAAIAGGHSGVQSGRIRLFVLPSVPAIPAVREAFAGTPVLVGAQDLHWEDRGPFTGAISGADLRAIGASLVEVGHAERRKVFNESESIVQLKFAAALRNGLTPVLCVGEREPLTPEDAGAECIRQIQSSLTGMLSSPSDLIVAYEPEWAIGADQAASASHVHTVTQIVRAWLDQQGGLAHAAVIYGGSAQPGTLTEVAGSVDGLFLGRFAHDPAALSSIMDEASALV